VNNAVFIAEKCDIGSENRAIYRRFVFVLNG